MFVYSQTLEINLKGDFHESILNCAYITDNSHTFLGKKSQKFSSFPLSSYRRVKS